MQNLNLGVYTKFSKDPLFNSFLIFFISNLISNLSFFVTNVSLFRLSIQTYKYLPGANTSALICSCMTSYIGGASPCLLNKSCPVSA